MPTQLGVIDDLIALAESAPISEVSAIVAQYNLSLDLASSHYFFAPDGASAEFEQTVLDRNDAYLNILLAKTVTSREVCKALWQTVSPGSSYSQTYRRTVRRRLLESPALNYLIGEGRERDGGVLSLPALLQEIGDLRSLSERSIESEYPQESDAEAILTNPYSRRLLPKIIERSGAFSALPDESIFFAVQRILKNPVLNIDETNNYDPDVDHWNLRKAISRLMECAPIETRWLHFLENLVIALEPEVFPLLDLSIEDFLNNWMGLNGGVELDETSENKPFHDGVYTGLNARDEFIVTCAAKFGAPLVKDKNLTLEASLNSGKLQLLAAFCGNKIRPTEVANALRYSNQVMNYSLLFNTEAMCDPTCRAMIREAIDGSEKKFLFDKRIEFLKKHKGSFFHATEINGTASRPASINPTAQSTSNKDLDSLDHKMTLLQQELAKAKRTLTIFIFAAAVVAIYFL